jgi:hypothetical protein
MVQKHLNIEFLFICRLVTTLFLQCSYKETYLYALFSVSTQLNTFVTSFLEKFWVSLKGQILEGFMSCSGVLMCAALT